MVQMSARPHQLYIQASDMLQSSLSILDTWRTHCYRGAAAKKVWTVQELMHGIAAGAATSKQQQADYFKMSEDVKAGNLGSRKSR